MKQLQEGDSRHIELERREKGFSVYLNGGKLAYFEVNSSNAVLVALCCTVDLEVGRS